jgi:DNA polymerase III delta prime subunit
MALIAPEVKEAREDLDFLESVRGMLNKGVEDALKASASTVEAESKRILERTEFIADELLKKVRKDLSRVKSTILKLELPTGETRVLSKPMNPYLPDVVKLVASGENVCLVGPAGCGKTQLAFQVAESLGLEFYTINFTSGASESWLLGRHTPTGYVPASLTIATKKRALFFADEMDAADPNVTICINTMLDAGVLYNPINGETIKLHPEFRFLAAANTALRGADAVYSGRNRQDGAFRDRFVLFGIDYVDTIDSHVCPEEDLRKIFQKARKKLKEANSSEFLSSRALRKAYTMTRIGFDLKKIIECLCMGWPQEIVDLCEFFPKDKPASTGTGKRLFDLRGGGAATHQWAKNGISNYYVCYIDGEHNFPIQNEEKDHTDYSCICTHKYSEHTLGLEGHCQKRGGCKCPHFWYDDNDPTNLDNYDEPKSKKLGLL